MSCRHPTCSNYGTPTPCPHHAQGEGAKRYEIVNPEIEALLRDIGSRLGRAMKPGWGFSLFIFSFGPPSSSTFYISSANRNDFIKNLREFLAREDVTSTDAPGDESRGHVS